MEKEKELDVIDQYKNITNKLKKKFLKKPNLAEGSEQYESLARQQKAEDSPHYAGMCFLAQARCEQSLGNWTAEATALTEAARSFIKAHHFFHTTHCVSFLEDLHSAINCYGHAIRVNNENAQFLVASQLCIELGNHLEHFGKTSESAQHYQRAISLLQNNPNECLHAMELLASVQLQCGDYDDALTTYTNIFNLAKQTASHHDPHELERTCKDMLRHCEVNMLLLLLYLEPTPQRTSSQHSRLLEKYTWDVDEEYLEGFCVWRVCETGLEAVKSHADEEEEEGGVGDEVVVGGSGRGVFKGGTGGGKKASSTVALPLRNYITLDLFFALQSLAMACQGDLEDEMLSSEDDLQKHFTAAQKHFTRLLVSKHVNKKMMQLITS